MAPDFQLTLFDERGLCEVTSPQFEGERLVICRNPTVAAERSRKREELLARTEQDLEKVKQMVEGERGKLKNAPAGKIGERAGRVVNKRKMAKHFSPCRSQTAASATSATRRRSSRKRCSTGST